MSKLLSALRRDPFTVGMVILGGLLILTLPFGLSFGWASSGTGFTTLSEKLGIHTQLPHCLEAWKLTAVLWSSIYLILYMIFKFPSAYPGNTKIGVSLGMLSLIVS